MTIKTNQAVDSQTTQIVTWSDAYATGIKRIDAQHKELVQLTNELYGACRLGNNVMETAFKEAMSSMVEYVRFHFTDELKFMEHIKYPDSLIHKKQHDTLVMDILEAVKQFQEGKKYVPNSFARTLKEWIFSHIAIFDKGYALFAKEQKKKGLLADIDFESYG